MRGLLGSTGAINHVRQVAKRNSLRHMIQPKYPSRDSDRVFYCFSSQMQSWMMDRPTDCSKVSPSVQHKYYSIIQTQYAFRNAYLLPSSPLRNQGPIYLFSNKRRYQISSQCSACCPFGSFTHYSKRWK